MYDPHHCAEVYASESLAILNFFSEIVLALWVNPMKTDNCLLQCLWIHFCITYSLTKSTNKVKCLSKILKNTPFLQTFDYTIVCCPSQWVNMSYRHSVLNARECLLRSDVEFDRAFWRISSRSASLSHIFLTRYTEEKRLL